MGFTDTFKTDHPGKSTVVPLKELMKISLKAGRIAGFIYLRNRKHVSSYRNTSGSLGEQEMLWEHKPLCKCFHSIH